MSDARQTIDRRVPRASLVLAAAAFAAGGAACDSAPSCEKAVTHAGEIRELDPFDLREGIKRCEDQRWSDATRSCIMKAKDRDALDECAARSHAGAGSNPVGYDEEEKRARAVGLADYEKRSRQTEAELNLNLLEKELMEYYAENDAFPEGDTGPTPPTACCEGPGHKCAPDAMLWQGSAWSKLSFSVDEPSFYQYTYTSIDSTHVTIEATGDLDCDGETANYLMHCDADGGTPSCSILRPDHAD
ncbi:MAG TPA: hypothetical protein VHE35_32765 [Kofleriaceae bacterium]|nr:hypothetical protein [Kofleriaceae bacterium]